MKIPLAFLAVTLVAPTHAADAPEISDEALRGYAKSMHKMTDEPHSVGGELTALCALNPAAKAQLDYTGPHYGHAINVFMNDVAQKHFAVKPFGEYPAGSIIVKEKLMITPSTAVKPTIVAFAGLIKHPPGYNQATDNWEFFYADTNGALQRGAKEKLASCADCHRRAMGDFIFGDFAKPKDKASLPNQPPL
jgi:hypothetical protein